MSKITLSPTHGLNPTLAQCFFCMEDTGVILCGRLPGDREAPRRVCINQEPCAKCAEWMAKGVILISVDEAKSTDLNNPYRTGGWIVVKDEVITRMGLRPEFEAAVLKRRCAFIPDDVWDAFGFPRPVIETEAPT